MSYSNLFFKNSLRKSSSGISTIKQIKKNNNIYIINNNNQNYYKVNNEIKNKRYNFNTKKNNVLFSNTYNSRNNFNQYNLNDIEKSNYVKNSLNNKNIQTKDNYYYNNNFFNLNNITNKNILNSQQMDKFNFLKKEINNDLKPKLRYSTSYIKFALNNKDIIRNHNFHITASNSLNNKNKNKNLSKPNLFDKEKIMNFKKKFDKYLIAQKYNMNINKIYKNIKYRNNIKECSPKNVKVENDQIKITKKRPKSTNYKFKNINNSSSLDDLLGISTKNIDNILNEKITKYTIGKTLGKGSYATVKIVTDKLTNQNYAMKIYDKSELKDKVRKNCLNNEIQILKKITHENIIKLIEVIELQDHILIIQELFLGISLAQYYKKNWKTEDLSKEKEKAYKIILKQIFEGINYLHKNNIAHLDLKLENILINKKLEIKIIDFGFGICAPKNFLNNFFGGTPNYMSPEIVLKRPYISILSDIWSLGVLVFKLFCNEYPFKGFTEKDLYNSIKKGKFRIKCYVCYDIKKIINSMLVLDPNKRMSCEQLLKNPWFNNK